MTRLHRMRDDQRPVGPPTFQERGKVGTHRPLSSRFMRRRMALGALPVLLLMTASAEIRASPLHPLFEPNRDDALASRILLLGTDSVDMVDPRIDRATGSLTLAITNRGEAAVSALSVNLVIESSGVSLGRYSTDAYPVLVTQRPDPSQPAADGLIFGGETERLTIPIDLEAAAPREGLLAVLEVALFTDHRYEGSASLANEVFSRRAEYLKDLERWTARLIRLGATAMSNQEALSVLEEMKSELVGSSSSRAGRRLLAEVNLKLTEASASPDETLTLLNHLVEFTRSDVEIMRQTVPPEYRRPREVSGTSPKGRSGGSPDAPRRMGGSTLYDCKNVTASRTLTEASCVSEGTTWIYDEKWNFTCSTPGLESEGEVNARGGCYHVEPWARNCPPALYGPTQSAVDAEQWWTREWENMQVAVSPISSRCVSDNMKQLAKACPCQEVEKPTQEGTNEQPPGGTTTEEGGSSPILIDLDRGGVRLTDLAGGVAFDLMPGGSVEWVAWTEVSGRDGFLVLDRNGNGVVDDGAELFGNFTPQPSSDTPNGFIALAVFDQPHHGGDSDGWITSRDRVFDQLRLWLDGKHDGYSEPDELVPLALAGVEAIELAYVESSRRDRHGNEFRYSSRVRMMRSTTQAVDVFLLTE